MNCKESLATNEINLGINPCNLIKRIYFIETSWSDCYREVAVKFTQLKQEIRNKAPLINDIELLQLINKFSEDDIKDYLGANNV